MAAFTIFFIVLMIVFVGAIYAIFNYVFNEFIGYMNPFIIAGDVSKQFMSYWNFTLDMWMIVPLLVLLIIAIYGVVEAIRNKDVEVI